MANRIKRFFGEVKETFIDALRRHFLAMLGVGASVVGWMGLVFLIDVVVKGLLPQLKQRVLVDVLIFLVVSASFLTLGMLIFIFKLRQRIERDGDLLRDPRNDQRQAYVALKNVYGWSFKYYKRFTTIHGGDRTVEAARGGASSTFAILISCDRHPLAEWSRKTESNRAVPTASTHAQCNLGGHKARIEHVSLNDNDQILIEKVVFDPPLPANTEAEIEFARPSTPDTFLTKWSEEDQGLGSNLERGLNTNEDYLDYTPREPTARFEQTIVFEGMTIEKVSATAVVGPAHLPIPREETDLTNYLHQRNEGGYLRVSLQIPHPVMGVTYRVWWKIGRTCEETQPSDSPDSPT